MTPLRTRRRRGLLVVMAMQKTGLSLAEITSLAKQNHRPGSAIEDKSALRAGNPDGPLSGVVVFTGELALLRAKAADAMAALGLDVAETVTRKTTLLVVGDITIMTKVAGKTKSTKHEKAERLIAKGYKI